MIENFPMTVITELAKMRIEIDLLTGGLRDDPKELEYITRLDELKNSVPEKIRSRIEEMIEDEVQRQFG
jgi:hypothetical protein